MSIQKYMTVSKALTVETGTTPLSIVRKQAGVTPKIKNMRGHHLEDIQFRQCLMYFTWKNNPISNSNIKRTTTAMYRKGAEGLGYFVIKLVYWLSVYSSSRSHGHLQLRNGYAHRSDKGSGPSKSCRVTIELGLTCYHRAWLDVLP